MALGKLPKIYVHPLEPGDEKIPGKGEYLLGFAWKYCGTNVYSPLRGLRFFRCIKSVIKTRGKLVKLYETYGT